MSILLQAERLIAGTVGANANVIFDSTVISTGNISYDSATGVVTIQEAGSYEFDWWVATQSSASTIGVGVGFELVSSQGDTIIGNSPIKTGEVVGVGVIEVAAAPVTVALRNSNRAAIYYATTIPVKASLAVIGTDNTGITGPTGPTGPCMIGQNRKKPFGELQNLKIMKHSIHSHSKNQQTHRSPGRGAVSCALHSDL